MTPRSQRQRRRTPRWPRNGSRPQAPSSTRRCRRSTPPPPRSAHTAWPHRSSTSTVTLTVRTRTVRMRARTGRHHGLEECDEARDRRPHRPRRAPAAVHRLDTRPTQSPRTCRPHPTHPTLLPPPAHQPTSPPTKPAQVDDDPVLRHLPYFGDDDSAQFDYLSYYESADLIVKDASTGSSRQLSRWRPCAPEHPRSSHGPPLGSPRPLRRAAPSAHSGAPH